jgi:Domain of unknown function (DUF1905)
MHWTGERPSGTKALPQGVCGWQDERMETLNHQARLWRWTSGNTVSWFFITIDGEAGDALAATALIRRLENGRAPGFGSIRVTARIGGTSWNTSAFPAKEGGFMLPVKAAVRNAEGLGEGDQIELTLEF